MFGKLFDTINVSEKQRRKNKMIDFISTIVVCIALFYYSSTTVYENEVDKNEISLEEIEKAFYNEVHEDNKLQEESKFSYSDPKLLNVYSIFTDITFSGGAKIPTFYKYTKYGNATNYIHTKEDNVAALNSTIIKIYYDRLMQSDIDLYKNALETKEGYTKIDAAKDKCLYVKQDSQSKYYTYVIIETDSITYGMKIGEFSK